LRWQGETPVAHADFLAWTDKPTKVPGAVNLGEIVVALRDRLPADAVICNGAGNFSGWFHRFWRFGAFPCQLAPTNGSMGYGLPAGVAAALRRPEATVLVPAGDGDFLMNGQELATAVRYGCDMLVLVIDNGSYGTIRMHQEREYPGRLSATDLVNPDFAALARAYGCWAETVESTMAFEPALDRALAEKGVRLLHLKTDVEHITNATTIARIRERAKR
jgi:acetolactate synthase-1/2/3 large subunit